MIMAISVPVSSEMKSFMFVVDTLHTRGSSHGGSRMVTNTCRKLFYVQMMSECYRMWRDIEQESGRKLYLYVVEF